MAVIESFHDATMRRWLLRVMIEARVVFPPGVWESAELEEMEFDFGNRVAWRFRARTDEGEPIEWVDSLAWPEWNPHTREGMWEARSEARRRLSAWLRLVLG